MKRTNHSPTSYDKRPGNSPTTGAPAFFGSHFEYLNFDMFFCVVHVLAVNSLTTLCLKKDTDVAHYNFNAPLTDFVNFWKRYC